MADRPHVRQSVSRFRVRPAAETTEIQAPTTGENTRPPHHVITASQVLQDHTQYPTSPGPPLTPAARTSVTEICHHNKPPCTRRTARMLRVLRRSTHTKITPEGEVGGGWEGEGCWHQM